MNIYMKDVFPEKPQTINVIKNNVFFTHFILKWGLSLIRVINLID